jgi:hypothetical protein
LHRTRKIFVDICAEMVIIAFMPITLTDEAKSACRRKPISSKRLTKILQSNYYNDMPTSEEARWLAARELNRRGFEFENLPKQETVTA